MKTVEAIAIKKVVFTTPSGEGVFIKIDDSFKKTDVSLLPKTDMNFIGFSHELSYADISILGINYYKYIELLLDKDITYNYQNYTGKWVVFFKSHI